MKSILAWLAVTCVVYLGAGYWVGVQLRPAVRQQVTLIEQNVGGVARVLGR